jgi:hypothetical protein
MILDVGRAVGVFKSGGSAGRFTFNGSEGRAVRQRKRDCCVPHQRGAALEGPLRQTPGQRRPCGRILFISAGPARIQFTTVSLLTAARGGIPSGILLGTFLGSERPAAGRPIQPLAPKGD